MTRKRATPKSIGYSAICVHCVLGGVHGVTSHISTCPSRKALQLPTPSGASHSYHRRLVISLI